MPRLDLLPTDRLQCKINSFFSSVCESQYQNLKRLVGADVPSPREETGKPFRFFKRHLSSPLLDFVVPFFLWFRVIQSSMLLLFSFQGTNAVITSAVRTSYGPYSGEDAVDLNVLRNLPKVIRT